MFQSAQNLNPFFLHAKLDFHFVEKKGDRMRDRINYFLDLFLRLQSIIFDSARRDAQHTRQRNQKQNQNQILIKTCGLRSRNRKRAVLLEREREKKMLKKLILSKKRSTASKAIFNYN